MLRRVTPVDQLPESVVVRKSGTEIGQTLFEAESFEGLLREVSALQESLIKGVVLEHADYLPEEYERNPGLNSVGMSMAVEYDY